MSDCIVSGGIGEVDFEIEDVNVKVIDKFQALSTATLRDDGLYGKMKATMYEYVNQLDMSPTEKANKGVIAISQFATVMAKTSMSVAEEWAETEATSPYTLAKIKLESQIVDAKYKVAYMEVCIQNAELDLIKQEIELERERLESEKMKNQCLYGANGTVCREMTLKENMWNNGNANKVSAETRKLIASTSLTNESISKISAEIGLINAKTDLADNTKLKLAADIGYIQEDGDHLAAQGALYFAQAGRVQSEASLLDAKAAAASATSSLHSFETQKNDAQASLVSAQSGTAGQIASAKILDYLASARLKTAQEQDIGTQSGPKQQLTIAQASLATAQERNPYASWANGYNAAYATIESTAISTEGGSGGGGLVSG